MACLGPKLDFLSSQAHLHALAFLISCHVDILTSGVSPRKRLPSQVQSVLTFDSQWVSFYQRACWDIRTASIMTIKDEIQVVFTARKSAWTFGSVAVVGTIRRHSCVGAGVALLEEVSHCGGELYVSNAQDALTIDTVHLMLPVDSGGEVSAPFAAPCRPACYHVPP